MPATVSVVIVTHNSARWLEPCLDSLFAQDYQPFEVIVIDNASTDSTRDILARYASRVQLIANTANAGFSAAQNQGIRAGRGEWFLCMNPDIILAPNFIREMIAAAERDARVGVVSGKLLRWIPAAEPERSRLIDSTGIYFTRNLRHFDRGSETLDTGQYDRPEYVFGATGAAALYRRVMVQDISVFGEFFDEDFFAYREDADLAWRAQLMGWRCLYGPAAEAWHVRRVTPARFHQLPHFINWHSIKNRFLMRAKNISAPLYRRLFLPITWRDLLIVGYCLLRDWKLLSAVGYVWKTRASLRRKRAWIQSHRRVSDQELARWFNDEPTSFPIEAAVPATHS